MLLAATRLIRSISLPRVTTAQNLLRNSSVASFKSPRRAFSVLLSHGIRPRHLLSVPAGVLLSTAIVSNRTLCAAEESGAAAAAAAGMDELQRTVPDENADIARAFPFSYAIVGELGFGGVAGFCTGYAVKKLGKSVAVVAGVGFISIQALAYSGVITVDWKKVKYL
eukprot:TRINITY_DN337_c0_g1_i2.p1 TRINITY_DN337_c0_g1~~TRINITY_DN337_c0_g1_i2.p1  ORF type:complete len:167 (-),score=26.95 TRINITY_DN337_c0_g1_i2:35-535(-)